MGDEDRFRLLVDLAPVCIHEIDLDGRLTAMNPAGLAMLGLEEESQICGRPYLASVSDQHRPRIRAVLERALEGESSEFEFLSSGADPRWFSSSLIPIKDEDGRVAKLMGVAQDVTARRRAETELLALNRNLEAEVEARTAEILRANAELKRSNRELDQFARVTSHDLRAPLRLIASYAELARNEYGMELDSTGREYLDHIVASARRLRRLIDDILEVSRVDRVSPRDGSVALMDVVAEVVRVFDLEMKQKNVRVEYDALPVVRGDRGELTRVFQNLIDNAIKFRRDAESCVRIVATQVGANVRVSVIDNGIGIREEDAERVFGLFERLHTAQEFPGTGLGLAICRKIIEGHGGRIWLTSTPGAGTAVHFTLAAAVAASNG